MQDLSNINNAASKNFSQYDDAALLRLPQIIGNTEKGIKPLIAVSRSTFLMGVKSGLYPKPVRLGVRNVAWRYADLIEAIKSFQA